MARRDVARASRRCGMRALTRTSQWGRATGLALGIGALVFTFACSNTPASQIAALPQPAANQPGTPVMVSCEPHQRTIVRPVVVNGAAISQVECVAAANAPVAQ